MCRRERRQTVEGIYAKSPETGFLRCSSPARRQDCGKGILDLLANTGSLAGALTQIVQLGTAHVTAAGNLNGSD